MHCVDCRYSKMRPEYIRHGTGLFASEHETREVLYCFRWELKVPGKRFSCAERRTERAC
jgi:hypothetical protein